MLWSALLSGASAGLAAVIAGLIVRDRKRKQVLFGCVAVVLFFILNGLSRSYILPEIRAMEVGSEIQEALSQDRAISILVARHPEIKEQFEGTVVGLVRDGASAEEIRSIAYNLGHQLAAPYFQRYVWNASDTALIHFVNCLVEVLDRLEARQDDVCFRWLFGGHDADSPLPTDVIGEPALSHLSEAMADVLETSLDSTREIASLFGAELRFRAFLSALAVENGADFRKALASLEQPYATGVDKQAACWVTATLYREALLLPERDRLLVLRYLFAP
ncbi:MAG: hypothetical protein JRJ19_10320 [Deltaproteobacteria bacterium]|nr:hypothetical protein [Deltaproteobacteria bacterium]